MKKIVFGYVGYAANITDKRHFNRQYHGIKAWAANNKIQRVQFVAEFESEQARLQKEELENLLTSRIQSGDTLIADPRTLGSSMFDVMKVLSQLVQKGVTVYCLQGSELVWYVEPKVMTFIESVIAEIHGEEGRTPKNHKGNEGKVES